MYSLCLFVYFDAVSVSGVVYIMMDMLAFIKSSCQATELEFFLIQGL